MDTKLINLSPRGILNNLKRIENVLKHEELCQYKPLYIDKEALLNDAILCKEAKSMLEFVGLKNYVTDVKFDETPDGVAGNISSANNTYERAVHINVSNSYKNRWKCCIAILAHEICHKVLAVNGLYENDTETNETLVDLSTIYVGFGDIILNGYVSESNQQIIGYLTLNTYKVAHHIVSVVYAKEAVANTGLADIDLLIDEALGYWEKAESEYSLLKDCFIEIEYQIAEFHRNITLLEQLLITCKQDLIHDFSRNDNLFFKNLVEKDGKFRNKLTALSLLYELITKEAYPKHKNNVFLSKVTEILNTAIYDLFHYYESKHPIELKYDFECPSCGTRMKNNDKVIDRNTILKCPNCGCHYYFFGERINFTRRQRELKEKRIKENEALDERVSKKLLEFRKKDQLEVARAKQEARDAITAANLSVVQIKTNAKQEIEYIRKNEQDEYKEKLRKRIPFYLRWLINKYI